MKRLTMTLAAAATLAMPAFAQNSPANPNPQAVQSGSYSVEPNHTRIQFGISHIGFTTFFGDLTGASGTLTLNPANVGTAAVDVTIPTASISTTNGKLDEELKGAQWLDAAQYPTISFVSTRVVKTGPSTASITGNLSLHGVTRPVVLSAKFNAAGVNPLDHAYTAGFDATGTINRSDFGVKTYLPVIGDAVTIRISAAFEKKAG